MDFMWAVEQMKQGKKVRRELWMDDYYIKSETKSIISNKNGTYIKYNIPDIEATDWELFKEPFNLSDKMTLFFPDNPCYEEEDIKTFIKQLKDAFDKKYLNVKPDTQLTYNKSHVEELYDIIDKLAGERLK